MGGPTGRQVHPAFTDEQQFGRKRCLACRQLWDGPQHHSRHSGRKASPASPQVEKERSASLGAPAVGDWPTSSARFAAKPST